MRAGYLRRTEQYHKKIHTVHTYTMYKQSLRYLAGCARGIRVRRYSTVAWRMKDRIKSWIWKGSRTDASVNSCCLYLNNVWPWGKECFFFSFSSDSFVIWLIVCLRTKGCPIFSTFCFSKCAIKVVLIPTLMFFCVCFSYLRGHANYKLCDRIPSRKQKGRATPILPILIWGQV